MIVSIHQPHFLPWIGYWNKALQSDVFIWLNTVQYRKNYYQNRTRIKNSDETPLWLTVPVHAKLNMSIGQVTIADPRWCVRIKKTLDQCYGRAQFFAQCWPCLEHAFSLASDSLDDVNFRTFRALLTLLEADCLCVKRAEDLPNSAPDPTLRLVEMCRSLQATRYIAGKGGRNYLRLEEFERAGIQVIWQSFQPEAVVYHQLGHGFVPGLSVIDCLFNEGPVKTRELIMKAWKP